MDELILQFFSKGFDKSLFHPELQYFMSIPVPSVHIYLDCVSRKASVTSSVCGFLIFQFFSLNFSGCFSFLLIHGCTGWAGAMAAVTVQEENRQVNLC